MWISASERLPERPGIYPIFCPSMDPNKPYRSVAWYEPEGTGNAAGWQLQPEAWLTAITHWMEWPPDPQC